VEEEEEEDETWISPLGVGAFLTATLALLPASLPQVDLSWLSVALASLGLLLVVLGLWSTRKARRGKDRVWFTLGTVLNGAVLLVALAFPGLLNDWWALNTRVAKENPEALVIVARRMPDALEEGRPLGEDAADATSEGVRQGDVLVSVPSAKVGPVSGMGETPYLIVQLRLTNCKTERTVEVEGFGSEQNRPVLTDDAGRSYKFVEQRPGKTDRNAGLLFAPANPAAAKLEPWGGVTSGAGPSQDYQLLFASPPSPFQPLKLEVPASAWGRTGVCRIRISRLF
jgi:hypothetical protein